MLSASPLALALLVAALVESQTPREATVLTARTTTAELRRREAAAPYLRTVAEYRAGRTQPAVRAALSWTRSDLRNFVDAPPRPRRPRESLPEPAG